jgi:two-component system, OmpR family, sensor histidine kinase MprB
MTTPPTHSDFPRADITNLWNEHRWHYQRSLASRVILLTTITVGLVAMVLALGAYATVRATMQRSLDQTLEDRADSIARQVENGSGLDPNFRLPAFALGVTDLRIVFVSKDGVVRYWDELPKLDLGQTEFQVAAGTADGSRRTVFDEGASPYRIATSRTGPGTAVVVAQSLQPQEEVLSRLGTIMLIFGGVSIVAAALAGFVVARNGLRPVRRLTNAVEEIAQTEDLRPLVVEGDDEVARLASAFNQMLSSLTASRDRQRRLVADASHELRTPLTSLRTNLDLLTQADLEGGLSQEARAELLVDVRAQLEELSTLVGDLVELARDDVQPHTTEALDLSEVVERALARARRRAVGLQFLVDVDPWWVTGEASSLERAVTNLLDNAVKWSPEGGTVHLNLHDGVITVDDEGPGISAADLPKVFDRFYRSHESRTMPGSGLGLSIVRHVAERHGGEVEAGRAPSGGARLQMRIPGDNDEEVGGAFTAPETEKLSGAR